MMALKFDRCLGSSATEMPVKFHSDTTILTPNLVGSRLASFGGQMSYRLGNSGLGAIIDSVV